MKITVVFKDRAFVDGVALADSFWSKLSGYMFRLRPHVPGFVFEGTSSIHTNFMFFDLDLAFIDSEFRVIKVVRSMRPWRFTWFYPKTRYVLELPVGVLPPEVTTGSTLEFKYV